MTARNTFSAVAWRDDDTARFVHFDPRRAGRAELGDLMGEDAASRWLKLRRRKQAGLPELREALGPGRRLTDRRVGRLAFDPAQSAIGDVRVPAGFDHSDRPWTVEADLADPTDVDFHLVGVSVEAAGTSFVVEALAEAGERTVRVESGDGHGLPIGPATFVVAAYRADGSRATSCRSVFVLPGNPLSLSLGPNGSRVIGTWSARGDFIEESDRSETDIAILEVMAAELDPFAAASAIGAGKKKINWKDEEIHPPFLPDPHPYRRRTPPNRFRGVIRPRGRAAGCV